jgi:hypothetical protein
MKIESTIETREEPSNETSQPTQEKVEAPLFARFLEKTQKVRTNLKAGLAKCCTTTSCG